MENYNLSSGSNEDCECSRCLFKKISPDLDNNIIQILKINIDDFYYIKDVIKEIIIIITNTKDYLDTIDQKINNLKNLIEESIRILHTKSIYFDKEINKITKFEKQINSYEKDMSNLNSRFLLIEEKNNEYNKTILELKKKINIQNINNEKQINKIKELEEIISNYNNKQTKLEVLLTSKINEYDLKLQKYIDESQYIFSNNELIFKKLNKQIEELNIKLNLSEIKNNELTEQIEYSNNLFLLVETLRSDHMVMLERLNTGEQVLQEIINKRS